MRKGSFKDFWIIDFVMQVIQTIYWRIGCNPFRGKIFGKLSPYFPCTQRDVELYPVSFRFCFVWLISSSRFVIFLFSILNTSCAKYIVRR